jgi:hypothetical protein
VVADYTLVPLLRPEQTGLLTTDPTLQRLAVEHGFRTTTQPAAGRRPAEWCRAVALTHSIPLPTYDNLRALVT